MDFIVKRAWCRKFWMSVLLIRGCRRVLMSVLLVGVSLPALAAPAVVVTIKPIYGLVASLMQDVGEPQLLLPDYASPHTFALKPSHYKQLHNADLIIWVGPHLETFLQDTLTPLEPRYGTLTLDTLNNLHHLPMRHDRDWQHAHDHNNHSHEDMDDPHVWLSIDNAKIIANQMAQRLMASDPQHATIYQKNLNQLLARLTKLQKDLSQQLASVKTQPYLVYHDGYQYFEKEFELNGVGTVVINPQLPLSAKAYISPFAFGFHAEALPVVKSSAAIRLRVCPPIVVNPPAA